MFCPVCGSKTKVTESRSDCEIIARRRKCVECEYVFYTTESELPTAHKDFRRLVREYLGGK